MRRAAFVVLAFVLGALQPAGAQDEKSVPKELIQYVRDAQKAGLKIPQIRDKALKAGWPEPEVEGALASIEEASNVTVAKASAAKDVSPEAGVSPNIPAAGPAATPPQPAGNQPAAPTATPNALTTLAAAPVVATNPASTSNPAADELRAKSATGPNADDYLIGEGDVLQVAVWGEPTASVPGATVRTDGKISMPLIKEVKVAGLTPTQVENIIQTQLAKVLRAPDVTVVVAQINSKKIFLTGAVKREGPLKYTYRMSVLQAISESGGLTDYAKRKKIYVLHSENGRQYRLPFDYTAVLKGEHMEQNIVLSPGDTIVVP